jgi:hypothetical protein
MGEPWIPGPNHTFPRPEQSFAECPGLTLARAAGEVCRRLRGDRRHAAKGAPATGTFRRDPETPGSDLQEGESTMNLPLTTRGKALELCAALFLLASACSDGESNPGRKIAQLTNAGDACMSCLLEGDPDACDGVCSIGVCPEACSDCLADIHNLDACGEAGVCPTDGSCAFQTFDGDHFCWADRTCGSLIDDAFCTSAGECTHSCADCIALENDKEKCKAECTVEPSACQECMEGSGNDWTQCIEVCPWVGTAG